MPIYKRTNAPSNIPNALSVYLRGLFTQFYFECMNIIQFYQALLFIDVRYLESGFFILLNLPLIKQLND